MALRLFPLLAGILSLYLLAKICKKSFPLYFAPLVFAFFVFNSNLVYFASEAKQYSFDVAATTVITYLTILLLEKKTRPNFWLIWVLSGSILIWCSQPVVFVLAASWLAMAYKTWKEKWTIIPLLAAAVTWAISFGVYFYFQLLPHLQNAQLTDYHTIYFMPLRFWEWDSLQWYATALVNLIGNPGSIFFKYFGAPIVLVGIFQLWKIAPARLMLFGLPPLIAILASGFGLYSTIPRLMLFSVPGIICILGYGLFFLFEKIKERSTTAPWHYGVVIFALFLLLQTFLNTAIHNMAKFKREEIKIALADIKQYDNKNNILYCYFNTQRAFRYYQSNFNWPGRIINGHNLYENWQADFQDIKKGEKIWLLFSHYKSDRGLEDQIYLNYVNKKAKQLSAHHDQGIAWYLYEWQ